MFSLDIPDDAAGKAAALPMKKDRPKARIEVGSILMVDDRLDLDCSEENVVSKA